MSDVKAGMLAHIPSSKFAANAGWLALALLDPNVARILKAAGAGFVHATTESLRTKLVAMPGWCTSAGDSSCVRPTNWR